MLKKLIIFNTPPTFTHPLLTNTLQSKNITIAYVSENIINKLKNTIEYDMITSDDFEEVERVVLQEEVKDEEKEIINNPINNFLTFYKNNLLHEKLLIQTESASHLLLKSFTSPHTLKIYTHPPTLSHTGKYLISNTILFKNNTLHYKLSKGKYYFSNDDEFLLLKKRNKRNETILYKLNTMEEIKKVENVNEIVFGKDIVVLDYNLIELKENVIGFYGPLIREKKNVVNEWVDSEEEEEGVWLKEFEDVWFSPYGYVYVCVVGEQMVVYMVEVEEGGKDKEEGIVKSASEEGINRNKSEQQINTNKSKEEILKNKSKEGINRNPTEQQLLKNKSEQQLLKNEFKEGINRNKSEEEINTNKSEQQIQSKQFEQQIQSKQFEQPLNPPFTIKSITRNISSDMIKSITFTPKRTYAIITKYVNNKLKYFIESYTSYVTVNEILDNTDLLFRFSDSSFLISTKEKCMFYFLKNKRFVLMNNVQCSGTVDLYKDYYCVNYNEQIVFYKRKELLNSVCMQNVNTIKYSESGLFVACCDQIRIVLFDCMGQMVWKKVFGDLRGVRFCGFERVEEGIKKMVNVMGNVEGVLGKERDLNVGCFRREVKGVGERRKEWLRFLCGLK